MRKKHVGWFNEEGQYCMPIPRTLDILAHVVLAVPVFGALFGAVYLIGWFLV